MTTTKSFEPGELLMTHFSVGEQVIIRYGRQRGQKARIIQSQPADVYKVRVEDGSILFFCGKGLQSEKEAAQEIVS